MVNTRAGAPVTVVEKCPECGSLELRVAEPEWFAVELERAEVRAEAAIEFRCRDCGATWR